MTESIDELGPAGWLVVEFPGSRFNSEIPLTMSAACLVWQNRWTPRNASAVRRAGGELVVNARIRCRHCLLHSKPTPPQWSFKKKESDMPLAARRMARAPVIGPAPAARTATTLQPPPSLEHRRLSALWMRSKREADHAPQTRTSADTRVGHR
jgi:hypothetical protein